MATISKTSTGSWKAVIKQNGRYLTSKAFIRKHDASSRARRIEADQQTMRALGSHGASMRFAELADELFDQWTGNSYQDQISRLSWWVRKIGDCKPVDIGPELIEKHLDEYAAGKARRGYGRSTPTRPRSKEIGRSRAPASVNRLLSVLSGCRGYAMKKR